MSIEDATKKLKKFCDYEDSVVLIDNALIEIQDAIEIVLGNLEALCDMQKSADRELENAKKINEEHRKENADLMKAINVVEKEKGEWIEDCNNLKKKVKELEKENRKLKVIRSEYAYGYENTYFITKNDLVQIDKNKYLIEIEEGKFVDLKQVYLINKNSIPKQKIKEKINENSNMIREIEEKIKKEENSGDICEEYLSDLYKEKSLVERDILTLQELLQEEDK